MNNKNILATVMAALLLLTLPLNAQHLLQTQGKIIVNQNQDTVLLRGMGLGGWMLQEGYMLQTASFATAEYQIRSFIEQLIGTTDKDLFYDAWHANHVTKRDIDSLKSWGFNSVRLPMNYKLYTLPIEDEPVPGQQTWLTKGFEMTDSLISWCKQNQMYVILDLHAAPGGQGEDQAISNYDPTKLSLWQSQANKDKTVALWKRLAQRYANEEWVAGYDLLNEVNWNLPGGTALRNLYGVITDSIRAVDQNHIIFIEGNWFANDFTGLTPPWDNNMVYSPHKYWSINDQASIQWVLDIRNNYNIPLYLGESGENSNVWFRDAIRLFEDNNIGWAWWPMKKVESIAGPLSVTKTPAYQALLDYGEGNASAPTAAVAKATLMQLTEDLKMENCTYQKDVIDAMFRQVYSDEPVPFRTQNIPGVVLATDFDMGVVGAAYYDTEVANYRISTNTFTSWNNGWAYRNDGIDIETCSDNVNTNGYNVGWTDDGEWMLYDVNVAADAVYDVNVRVAAGSGSGKFHFEAGGAAISPATSVANTGGWQSWTTITVPNVILHSTDNKVKFYVDKAGFNVSSFEFVQTNTPIASIPAAFTNASTIDENTVQLAINKPFDAATLTTLPAGFQIFADGNSLPITNISIDPMNDRIIHFTVNHTMKFNEILKVSYAGTQVSTVGGLALTNFTLEDIQNNLPIYQLIPGKIEAEDYFTQSGIQLEPTTDAGGGQNIGFLDANDYLDYWVDVTTTGTYQVDFRHASQSGFGTGNIEFQLVDTSGNVLSNLVTYGFTHTGGWQTWTTSGTTLHLPEGRHILRMFVIAGPVNINWMDFTFLTATTDLKAIETLSVFPNPSADVFRVEGELETLQDVRFNVYNLNGQLIYNKIIKKTNTFQEQISLANFPNGYYILKIQLENGEFITKKLIKLRD